MFTHSILSLLIWLPMLGGALALASGGGDRHPDRARLIALGISIVCLALCVPLYLGYDPNSSAMQFQENIPWIKAYAINYALGVDGISLPLILLTMFTTLLVIMASWHSIHVRVSQYMAAFLVMQGMMVGTFAARDSILFYA